MIGGLGSFGTTTSRDASDQERYYQGHPEWRCIRTARQSQGGELRRTMQKLALTCAEANRIRCDLASAPVA